ncbi:MAG: glycosyltransferase family A protein [bacterium]|nr:glycosyltransferase family A protein [bacterium]
MSLPTVTVIIPTYNRAHLISRAVESAIRETDSGDEIIIIDDGSKDNTQEVLKKFGDQIRYEKISNRGGGGARNYGVDLATRELIAYLDSDDEWFEGKLNLQKQLMAARKDVLFCFSDIAITTRSGEIKNNFLKYWHRDPRPWDEILSPGVRFSTIGQLPEKFDDFTVHVGSIYAQTAFSIYTVTSTTVVRREEAGDAIYHADDIPCYEDWIGFGKLAKKGQAAFLNVETAWQHSHSGPRMTDANTLTSSTTRLIILERLWGQDKEFLAEHGERYEALRQEQILLKAKSLIGLGRPVEAREYLARVKNPPTSLKLLAAMPNFCVKTIMSVRRLILNLLGRSD